MRIMRILVAALFALACIVVPCVAQSQAFSPIGTTIPTLQPIPPPECPPTPTYSFCDSLKAAVVAYNSQVQALNEVNAIKEREQEYLTYPQRLQSNVQSDLAALQGIVNQTSQAMSYNAAAQQTINGMFAPMQGQPAAVAQQLLASTQAAGSAFRDELLRGLGVSDANTSADARDKALADGLLSVAGGAKSPTQAVQLLVQMNGLVYNALSRAHQVSSEQLRFDVQQATYNQASRQQATDINAQMRQHNQAIFDPTLPTPGPSTSPQ